MRHSHLILACLLALLVHCSDAVSCVSCPFIAQNIDDRICDQLCEGKLCYLVANEYHNATIVAGCVESLDEPESKDFAERNTCYSGGTYTICGCMRSDQCNDPTTPLSNFGFSDKPILEHVYNNSGKDDQEKSETISIHPVVTIEVDNVTKAALATSTDESDDTTSEGSVEPTELSSSVTSEAINATGEVANETASEATVETTTEESDNATSAESGETHSIEATTVIAAIENNGSESENETLPETDSDSSELTVNSTKFDVLPSDEDEEDAADVTPSHPVSLTEERDEPISMKNMTAVGDVQEAAMSEDDKRSENSDDGSSTIIATETAHTGGPPVAPRVSTISAKQIPVAKASESAPGDAKSAVHFVLSFSVPLISMVLLL